jgi:hypothetical protein
MSQEWWRYLKGRPFYWVLDGSDPAASYYMLRYVVERPDSARAVQAARLALQESATVTALKAKLKPEGQARWTEDYSGPLWALRLLAEWGHPGDNETIATCLDWALETNRTDPHPDAPLLLLHAALAFGFTEDERVALLIEHTLAGIESKTYIKAESITLLAIAFAASAENLLLSSALHLLESLLSDLAPTGLPHFADYTYPTFDRPDGITLAESAIRLGLRGEWLEPWIQQIVAAQDEEGYWRASRVHLPGATADSPNRWVSAKAMYVLRSFYGE